MKQRHGFLGRAVSQVRQPANDEEKHARLKGMNEHTVFSSRASLHPVNLTNYRTNRSS
jgi:hypothetical protein